MIWSGWLKEKYIEYSNRWASRSTLITSIIEKKRPSATGNCSNLPSNKIRLAAVQLSIAPVNSVQEYIERVWNLIDRAAAEGAHIAVLPKRAGIPLIGTIPAVGKKGYNFLWNLINEQVQDPKEFINTIQMLSPATSNIYGSIFSLLAKLFGIYICTGSLVAYGADQKVYDTSYIYDPSGSLIGIQRECRPGRADSISGISPGMDLNVYDTLAGKIGISLGSDSSSFEACRVLSQRGAEIILAPDVEREPANPYTELKGIWCRVQENLVYAVKASAVGEFMGVQLSGRSAIFAPIELTPNRDGYIAQAQSTTDEEVVIAELDRDALNSFRAAHPNGFNISLYRKYL